MKTLQLDWDIMKKDEGKLLRDFLKEHQISKRALTAIKFTGGDLLVNDEHVTVRYILKAGDHLKVIFPKEEISEGILAEHIPLDIVYEDDHCLVINKQPYIPSIPSREHPTGSLANGILYYYQQKDIPSTVHLVNRLDMDTSGLMVVAKHRFAHSLFSTQQRNGQIKRTYEAIVEGLVKENEGTISAPIGRKAESIIERVVREDGQKAITHFHVIERFNDKSHVSLQLETGRTHQIRVHMAHLGHPLCGDTLYGGQELDISRQALHSKRLNFFHPILNKEFSFQADLPNDMKIVLKNARAR